MKEVWKDIRGYEGKYQVSNLGRVKSFDSYGKIQYLKPTIHHNGYLQIVLYKNNKYLHYKVHRLVAQAFIPNAENKPEVNHKNCIKTDNRVDNLEWCTRQENVNHAVALGKYQLGKYRKNKRGNVKLRESDIVEIRKLKPLYTFSDLALKYHVTESAIKHIVYRHTWTEI
jgi:hypothetical protein